jgi:hypothetical protein
MTKYFLKIKYMFMGVCLILAVPSVTLLAQTSEAGVLFLLIPPGARHNAMGETGVSTVKDANAIYWNPGALGFIADQQHPRDLQFMHVNWLPQFKLNDLFYDYGSFIWYLPDIGVVGANFTFFNLGEQQITSDQAEVLGTVTSFDLSFGLTYATKLSEDWGVGGNLKYIYSRLSNKSVTGESQKGTGNSVAIDVGVMKKNLWVKDLTFGASIANIGPKIAYVDQAQADPLPTNLRMGLSYPVYKSEFNTILLAYEINREIVRGRSRTSDPLLDLSHLSHSAIISTWGNNGWHRLGHNFGAEYSYSDFLALRTGTSLDLAGKLYDLTFGAGIKYSIFKIDFAYTTKLGGGFNPRDGSQFYSLGFTF